MGELCLIIRHFTELYVDQISIKQVKLTFINSLLECNEKQLIMYAILTNMLCIGFSYDKLLYQP